MRKPNFLILKLCAAALAALLSVATSHALLIDVKALYSDRYSIESVEVTNLANGASVTLEPGQTLALDSAEPRTADVRLPFVDGDDVRFTARATDGEVTVITERPDDDHTVWVHFINTLDSSGRRHTVHKIGGLYYITKGANPDALVNKSWHRPTADDLKATSDYFNNTKVRGLYFEKRLPQAGTLRRGMRAFTADTDADNDGVIEIDEGDPTIEDPAFDLSDASVSREREANHRAMVATMLGFDPDLVQPNQKNGIYGHGKERWEAVEKVLGAHEGDQGEDIVWEALRASAQDPKPEDVTSNTQWSAIYDNTGLTLEVCLRRNWNDVSEFSIN